MPANLVPFLIVKAAPQIGGRVTQSLMLRHHVRKIRKDRIKTLGEWIQTMHDINCLPEYLDED